MPALNPPSMQIGALPMGASTLTTQPAGPSLGYGFNDAPAQLVQQVAGASSSAAPATFTLAGITATKVGTCLVALVSVAQSGAASVSTPSGWTVVAGASGSNAGNTLGARAFLYPANPGGITSVVFSTLSGVNGIAVWLGEFSSVFAADPAYANATYSNGSTAPAATAYTPIVGPVLLVGCESDVTGQAYTPANTGVGTAWVAGTTATSTTGATNTILRPFWTLTTPELQSPYQLKGTLAGSIACGAALVSLLCGTTGPLTQPTPEQLQVGAWGGGLGPTKPGGAGGGQ